MPHSAYLWTADPGPHWACLTFIHVPFWKCLSQQCFWTFCVLFSNVVVTTHALQSCPFTTSQVIFFTSFSNYTIKMSIHFLTSFGILLRDGYRMRVVIIGHFLISSQTFSSFGLLLLAVTASGSPRSQAIVRAWSWDLSYMQSMCTTTELLTQVTEDLSNYGKETIHCGCFQPDTSNATKKYCRALPTLPH